MRARDEADFEEFVVASTPRLFRAAYAVCGDVALAEDAVQAALTSACLAWRRVRAADNPEAYVRRMVINQLFDWRRRKFWRAERVTASPPEQQVPSHEDGVVTSEVVWQCLGQLPPRQRAVVVLRYYEGLSEQEIAEVLGIRPGTVKSQSSAALAHLRERLGPRESLMGEESR